jgi:hypothetical protein
MKKLGPQKDEPGKKKTPPDDPADDPKSTRFEPQREIRAPGKPRKGPARAPRKD